MNLSIQDFLVDRAPRNGRPYNGKDGSKKQIVLVKFTSWNAQKIFYKARKHSNFHIKLDLSRNEVLNHIHDEINNQTSTASKLFNYVFVDANCNVMFFLRKVVVSSSVTGRTSISLHLFLARTMKLKICFLLSKRIGQMIFYLIYNLLAASSSGKVRA